MARGKRTSGGDGGTLDTAHYRHSGSKRTNIPPAKIAAEGKVPRIPKARYHYSPHLPPVLRFDSTGKSDKLPELIEKAGKQLLNEKEQKILADALRTHEPWLEWAQKREQHERGFFDVDPVALHIHERVSAEAIVRTAMREDYQRDLFADPQQKYEQAVQFYRHDVDWANRLILGDSLQVMSSLARRENLAGKVQMIYMDPPYGIRFGSNFQPEVGKRDVKDKETDLTREPETVRAYRDTWRIGVHSYLAYLRERLIESKQLLSDSGSLFVQISDENIHLVRALLDEVFGPRHFCGQIPFKKTGGQSTSGLPSIVDYLLWYSKERDKVKYRQVFVDKKPGEEGATNYAWIEEPTGSRRPLTTAEMTDHELLSAAVVLQPYPMFSDGPSPNDRDFTWRGQQFKPSPNSHWKTTGTGLQRLASADRLVAQGKTLRFVNYLKDYPVTPITNMWSDTQISGFGEERLYVVQTLPKVIQRCMLMTTEPGDLVFDPTCGSGTTALVAENWGRRWITADTSRVAIAIARQRLVTAKFDHYKTKESPRDSGANPGSGLVYKTVPHITLKSIAQNPNLDPIFAQHQPLLDAALTVCTKALKSVGADVRKRLGTKVIEKQREGGKRALTDADRRRWELPSDRFEHWTVPFDTDPDWPKPLADAVTAYRKAWRAKMEDVNSCIENNADQEELVDKPEIVSGVLRVSGPFTVEGVRPEELSLGEEGLFDGTPNEFEQTFDKAGSGGAPMAADKTPTYRGDDRQNLHAYLDKMVGLLRQHGVVFLNNKRRTFARVEPLFESSTGTLLHAEGAWSDATGEDNDVAIAFGPQYGPVTAYQVEELIHATKRYKELVVAGFSFDAEACATIQEQENPRLRIHQAYIRPDENPAMEGLLKPSAGDQIFSVFGQPDVEVKKHAEGWVCHLKGVDVYDPVKNELRSTGADKVAAWFLDSDFDGRCFCITQAFFPDKDAWDKIANALKARADEEAFARLSGTESIPFPTGRHRRIAVKVIDPRGNEVMAIRALKG